MLVTVHLIFYPVMLAYIAVYAIVTVRYSSNDYIPNVVKGAST